MKAEQVQSLYYAMIEPNVPVVQNRELDSIVYSGQSIYDAVFLAVLTASIPSGQPLDERYIDSLVKSAIKITDKSIIMLDQHRSDIKTKIANQRKKNT